MAMAKFILRIRPDMVQAVAASLPPQLKLTQPQLLFGQFVAVDIPHVLVSSLVRLPGVLAVLPDKVLGIKAQYAAVEDELASFSRVLSNPFTLGNVFARALPRSGVWLSSDSRKVVGADVADVDGITGKGVKVAVLDTGFDPTIIQRPGLRGESTLSGQPGSFDENGHSCATGDSSVFTTFCGLTTLQELFERTRAEFGSQMQPDGTEMVIPTRPLYTIGWQDESQKTPLKAIHRIPYKGDLLHIHLGGGTVYETSPWHPFLVRDRRSGRTRYMRADEITASRNYQLVTAEKAVPLFTEYQTITFESKTGHQVRWGHPWTKENIVLDERLAYLAGLVVGDGHLGTNKIRHSAFVSISLGDAPFEPLEQLLDELGFRHHRRADIRKGRPNRDVGVSARLHSIMMGLGIPEGEKAAIVEVPERVIKSPPACFFAFVAGLIDSDGSFAKDRPRMRISTASPKLASQLVAMLSVHAIHARLHTFLPSPKSHGKLLVHHVEVTGRSLERLMEHCGQHLRYHRQPCIPNTVRGRGRWVRRVERTWFEGSLYDETTGTQNYLCGKGELAFIHNTWCVTMIGGKKVSNPLYGTIQGVAPGCDLIVIKVLGYLIGSGAMSGIIAGMQRAADLGAKVISMSLGGPDDGDPNAPEMVAIRALAARGIVVVVAAGNSGPGISTIDTPGSSPDALTVGAVDVNMALASFSGRGPSRGGLVKPDCVAPGVNILSSSTGLIAAMRTVDGPRVAAISGTSMATPHIAGVVALGEEYARKKGKTLTTAFIKAVLTQQAGGAKNNDYGWGLLTYPMLKAAIG